MGLDREIGETGSGVGTEKKLFLFLISKFVLLLGFSKIIFLFSKIIFGFCFGCDLCVSLAARYRLPLVALHLRQAGTRLLSSDVPPRSVSMR